MLGFVNTASRCAKLWRSRACLACHRGVVQGGEVAGLEAAGLASLGRTASYSSSALGPKTAGDKQLSFAFATSCMPHPEKVSHGGDDAYFACPDMGCFGIADGVGGGANAAEMARRVMKLTYEGMHSGQFDSLMGLQEVLEDAAYRLRQEQVPGSTTVLIGKLHGSTLAILNLGDSGAILLRPALRSFRRSKKTSERERVMFPRVVFRSSDQTHYFNCPYQLSSRGPPAEEPDMVFVQVRPGDIVIAASDGVFDNLFDHQVQAIVAYHLGAAWKHDMEVETLLPSLADGIAEQARAISLQENKKDTLTPFSLTAQSEKEELHGGKLDDIAIVIGLVQEGSAESGMTDLRGDGEPPYPFLRNFD